VAFWAAVWLAGAGVAAGSVIWGWRFLTGPERFPLDRVVVEGAPPEVTVEVASTLERLHGQNIFSLDLRALEHRVRAHPWVSAASVQRRLPDALLVFLSLRTVEALVEVGGEIRMVGADGQDLGRYEPRWAREDQPVITGVAGTTRQEVAGKLALGLSALEELRAASPEFVGSLSALDVSRRDRLTATLRDFIPPVYLSPDAPARNLDRLDTVRARLAEEVLEIRYVDLRFRDRIAVMPVLDGDWSGGA
jgi:cell division septal protein FtsQ